MRGPALAAATLLALLGCAHAFAHAEPAKVRPGDGAVLTTPPDSFEIVMSQDLARREGANDIDVFDAAGNEVTTAPAVIDNANRRRLTVALASPLAPGTYTVKWKSLSSEDGDAASGTLSFTFDPNGTANPGRETLREDLLGTGSGDAPANAVPAVPSGGGSHGVTWILAAAAALGALVLGSGATFLFVQKRP